MAQAPSYDARKPIYTAEWKAMVIEVEPPVTKAAQTIIKNKARYQAVEKGTGVPWFFIACIHWREASGSFAGVLHNGEKIIGTGRKTKLVPAGRGPFATWEAAAVDALKMRGLNKIKIDCVERFCFEAEAFNGWGYFYHSVPSAYLWSMSSVYKGGKYVADGVWDAHALDSQVGVMPLLRRLMALDLSIGFATATPMLPDIPAPQKPTQPVLPPDVPMPQPKPEPPPAKPVGPASAGGVAAGGTAIVVAAKAGLPWWQVALIGLAVLAVAGAGIWFAMRKKGN